MFEAGGVTVGDPRLRRDRPRYYFATRIDRQRPCAKGVAADVKKARDAGADVVIVFPHWGVEYRATAVEDPAGHRARRIDAGADMIIGNHAHWAAAVEIHKGKPIWYALGNFVFDQTWSEPTMEGITPGADVPRRGAGPGNMRPHIILDKAQPNFLDPAGDGKVVLARCSRRRRGFWTGDRRLTTGVV
jgi:hypothetical protein